MAKAADALERETLAGRIRSNASSGSQGDIRSLLYRPCGMTKKDIRLARASSMVTELAPGCSVSDEA